MNTAVVALVVAAITAGAGLVQGIVQGALALSGAGVAARQRAVDAEIVLLRRVSDRLVDMTQAASSYVVSFDSSSSKQHWQIDVLKAESALLMAALCLPATSATRVEVLKSIEAIRRLSNLRAPQQIKMQWERDRTQVERAVEVCGEELRAHFNHLHGLAKGPVTRAFARIRRHEL